MPSGTSTGARLTAASRGVVSGAAAIGTATANTDGSGRTALAVASPSRIRFFLPGKGTGGDRSERTVALRPAGDVDSILPVSNAQGRIAFLMHAAAGWSVVSAAADGTDVRGPTPVTGIPADAQLAPPAWSNGSLYTIDRSGTAHGRIYRITADAAAAPVAGAPTYPLASRGGRVAESSDVSDAYLVARGTACPGQLAQPHRGGRAVHRRQPPAADHPQELGRRRQRVRRRRGADPQQPRPQQRAGQGRRAASPPRRPGARSTTRSTASAPTRSRTSRSWARPTPGSRSVALQWTYPDPRPAGLRAVDLRRLGQVDHVRLAAGRQPRSPCRARRGSNLTGLYPEHGVLGHRDRLSRRQRHAVTRPSA